VQLRVEELPEEHVRAGGDSEAGAGEEAGSEEGGSGRRRQESERQELEEVTPNDFRLRPGFVPMD
jgi:hypothetical protein